ncbi:MAG TPA: DUF1015 family protein [Spirochaetota bacterium]|nr:DUF1015 family protein [Spirochaetota bacterium]
MRLLKPLANALIAVSGKTAGKNYDEFQNDNEIREIIKNNPRSILRVTMPHCSEGSRAAGPYSKEGLAQAAVNLKELIHNNSFKNYQNIYYVYKIDLKSRPGMPQIGLGCMAAASAIWDKKHNPDGIIVRNEDVFKEKAQGRADIIKSTGSLIGTVNLFTEDEHNNIKNFLLKQTEGEPAVQTADDKGNIHSIFVLDADAAAVTETVNNLFSKQEIYVADGNHRSLAAALAGLDYFLTVIFCADTMNIDPYNRLLRFPDAGIDFLKVLPEVNMIPHLSGDRFPFRQARVHEIGLYYNGQWYKLTPLNPDETDPVASLDSSIVEKRIIKKLLKLDPGSENIAYIGGDYDHRYLEKMVNNNTYNAALFIPAVSMHKLVDINRLRKKMPRKTTWFTPKISSGLVIELLQ